MNKQDVARKTRADQRRKQKRRQLQEQDVRFQQLRGVKVKDLMKGGEESEHGNG